MICRLSLSGKAFLNRPCSHRYGGFTKLAAAASQLLFWYGKVMIVSAKDVKLDVSVSKTWSKFRLLTPK